MPATFLLIGCGGPSEDEVASQVFDQMSDLTPELRVWTARSSTLAIAHDGGVELKP